MSTCAPSSRSVWAGRSRCSTTPMRPRSPVARKRRGIGLRQWATEFWVLLARYEAYLSPDLIIFGGGMVKDYPRFAARLHSRARLVPAVLGTNAGIVGAARVGSLVKPGRWRPGSPPPRR